MEQNTRKEELKMKKTAALFLCLIVVLTLCLLSGNPAAAKTVPKGKVVVGIPTNLQTLDPALNPGWVGQASNWNIFDPLVIRDPVTLKLTPHLAESWKLVDDETWELKLRKGVRFHNGDPFNAECVKYTFDRRLDPKLNAPGRGLLARNIKRIEIVDDYLVRFHTKGAMPYLADILGMIHIVDPKYIKAVGDEVFGKKPNGTGPFKFVEWVKGQRLVLEANENYWKFTPAVKTLVFRPIPETATQIAELLSGGVDLIFKVPPDQISIIERSKEARILKGPALRHVYVLFDAMGRAGSTPMQNKKVRQAINHAIDMEAIMKYILGGLAIRAPSGLNPLVFGADNTIKAYPYDPEKARSLLKEAGYPDGFTMTLNSLPGRVVSVTQVAQAISGDLAKVGIKVKYRHHEDFGTGVKEMTTGKMKDFILHSWGSGGIFDADMVYAYLFRTGSRWAYASDPKMNELVISGRTTMSPEKRKKIYSDLQKHIKENAYIVPGYAQYFILGVSNRIDYRHSTDERVRLFDITWRK